MVLVAAQICDDKKATDTRILELDPVDAGLTDFFVITSATNNRQTGAIADEIELRMKRDFGTYAKSVEGRRAGEWILLDYVDFVVHVFTEQTREYYDIERLRKSARAMDLEGLTAELRERTEAVRQQAPAPGAVDAEPAAKSPRRAPRKAAAKRTGQDAALQQAVDEESPTPALSFEKVPVGRAAAKKVAAKKVESKEAAAKKVAAKKVATKKAAIKKVAAKKVATKKVATKRVATKKVATKKPVLQTKIALAKKSTAAATKAATPRKAIKQKS